MPMGGPPPPGAPVQMPPPGMNPYGMMGFAAGAGVPMYMNKQGASLLKRAAAMLPTGGIGGMTGRPSPILGAGSSSGNFAQAGEQAIGQLSSAADLVPQAQPSQPAQPAPAAPQQSMTTPWQAATAGVQGHYATPQPTAQ